MPLVSVVNKFPIQAHFCQESDVDLLMGNGGDKFFTLNGVAECWEAVVFLEENA
jgi:hypothetical protein